MNRKSQDMAAQVGEPWPKLEVQIEELSRGTNSALHVLLVLCAGLLIALTAFGMANGEMGILDTVLTLVRDVLIGILGWAIGRQGSR